MKQFLHSYRLFLIVAALCTLSAFWLLGARIGVEQTQRQVDVVVSYEDVCALSDASGIPVQDWLTQLADAGARELLVTPAELADPDIVRAAQDAGLGTAQAGGLAQGGTYFFAARYDTLAAAGQTGVDTDTEPLAQAQVLDALRESGSTLVLIEDRNQTGCVLPDGYTLDGYTGSMVKGFWLNQTFRARYQTLGYSGAEEIVNMLYRAVVDRGMTVLWLTPLTDAAGETVAQPEVYTQLLQDLAQRIAPAGYQYGSITGIPAKTVSPVLLMLCGIGVFAAAIVLLGVFVSLRARAGCVRCCSRSAARRALAARCSRRPFRARRLRCWLPSCSLVWPSQCLQPCCAKACRRVRASAATSARRRSAQPSRSGAAATSARSSAVRNICSCCGCFAV